MGPARLSARQRSSRGAMGRSVWSCYSKVFASSEDALYGDRFGERYEYNSNVVNSSQVSEGDVLVIRDAQLIYGFGIAERIDATLGHKLMQRCPECGRASMDPRKTRLPKYRCLKCKAVFDFPRSEPLVVTEYVSHYGRWWVPLPSPAPIFHLRDVYASGDRQNAIRRLDAERAERLINRLAGVDGEFFVQASRAIGSLEGGFLESAAKVRRGQSKFRQALIGRFGAVCAVTGPQPEQILDAAHLYPFSEDPRHDLQSGLLFRADVHRLFDRLVLTIDPMTWQARVDPGLLERFALLRDLSGSSLVVEESRRPRVDLLHSHFKLATQAWRDRRRR
ncbi:HNH endonuclease [Oerskovia sp. KBS0722]|nr:HNH endonuclease [Oerskovia sp. KBS0722]